MFYFVYIVDLLERANFNNKTKQTAQYLYKLFFYLIFSQKTHSYNFTKRLHEKLQHAIVNRSRELQYYLKVSRGLLQLACLHSSKN